MAWIMSSAKRDDGIHFFIGAIEVAHISFVSLGKGKGYKASLMFPHKFGGHFESVGLAMKEMHRQLNAPGPDDANVSQPRTKTPAPADPPLDSPNQG